MGMNSTRLNTDFGRWVQEHKKKLKVQYKVLLKKIDGSLTQFWPYGVDKILGDAVGEKPRLSQICLWDRIVGVLKYGRCRNTMYSQHSTDQAPESAQLQEWPHLPEFIPSEAMGMELLN
jgi:hypothetical protein